MNIVNVKYRIFFKFLIADVYITMNSFGSIKLKIKNG